jgi:hypothetical protein
VPAWQTPPSFPANTIVPSSKLNILTSNLLFLGAPPCGTASAAAVTSIPGPNNPTQVVLSEFEISGGMGIGSSGLTVPYAGQYLFFAQLSWPAATNVPSYYEAILYQNGVAGPSGVDNADATSPTLLTTEVEYVLTCAALDTITLYAEHDSATAFNATGILSGFWISN